MKKESLIKTDRLYLALFKISYGLFLTYSLLGHISQFATVLKLGTYVGIALLIINFLLHPFNYDKKTLYFYACLMILGVIALLHSYYSQNYGFIKLLLFSIAIVNIKFKDLIKFDMYLRGILILTVVILCKIGIATDVVVLYNGISLRHSMGFTNPNTLGIATFILVCDILYICDMKLNLKSFIAISAITVWLYYMSRSRTALLLILFIVVLAFINRLLPKLFSSDVLKMIFYLTPVVLSIITFIVVKGYISGDLWAEKINELLSGRVNSIANFVEELSITFWGQPIHETLDKTLDNTYAFVLYDLGICVFALFMVSYFLIIKRNIKDNTAICLIAFCFMVYGLSEHLWINVDYNIFMLVFVYNVFDVTRMYDLIFNKKEQNSCLDIKKEANIF